jgi:hypothetical protein
MNTLKIFYSPVTAFMGLVTEIRRGTCVQFSTILTTRKLQHNSTNPAQKLTICVYTISYRFVVTLTTQKLNIYLIQHRSLFAGRKVATV